EALFLTNFATKVTLVHRRDELRAERILQNRLLDHDKIEVVWDHVLEEIHGTGEPPAVTGVTLRHTSSNATRELPLAGVFIAIGHRPNTEIFRGKLEMDDEGYIITAPDSTRTSVPGVFAAGDVQDKVFRQAVTAAGTGCMGALEAEKYLAENEAPEAAAAE
ncbi:MAG: FAD-dependent oxidoreductase, partial [Chlorobiales bacterium]|nr:FAD-dependent oxidoreductase [Chlorobiales bacterium]